MARSLDEILAAAVKVIKPPADSVEAFRAQLTACIDAARRTQATVNVPPPGEMRERAKDYLKALRVAKRRALAFHPPAQPGQTYPWDNFLAELDREINQVDALAWGLVVPSGSPQRNVVADIVAIMARDLIDPNPYRHPENYERLQGADKDIGGGRVHRAFTMKGELVRPGRKFSPNEVLAIPIANRRALIKDGYLEVFPAVETCPWRRRATLTDGGVWPTLAALIYEGGTGEAASDSMMMKIAVKPTSSRRVTSSKGCVSKLRNPPHCTHATQFRVRVTSPAGLGPTVAHCTNMTQEVDSYASHFLRGCHLVGTTRGRERANQSVGTTRGRERTNQSKLFANHVLERDDARRRPPGSTWPAILAQEASG